MIASRQPLRFGIARKLSIAFAAVGLAPLSLAVLVSLLVILDQARLVETEVLWGKVELAAQAYSAERDRLGRALDAAASSNAILLNLEIGLDSALSGLLADLARGQGLDGAWLFDAGSRGLAAGRGEVPAALDALIAPILAAGAPSYGGVSFAIVGPGVPPFAADAALVGARRLEDGRGALIGYIVASIDLKRLSAVAAAASGGPAFFALGSGPWICSPGLAAAEERPPRLDGFKQAPGPARAQAATAGTGALAGAGEVGGDRYLFRLAGLKEGGAMIGIAYPEASIVAPRTRGLLGIALAGLGAVALASAAAARFRRLVALPLASLAGATRRVADGVYGPQLAVGSRDEVGDLAHDFNAMTERLLAQDVERRRAEEALRASEAQFRAIFDGVSDAIFVHDAQTSEILDTNRAMRKMFGYDEGEPYSGTIEAISEGVPPYDQEHALLLMARARSGENPVIEWRARRRDGSLFWVETAFRLASIGGIERILVTGRDITARREAERKVEESLREKETLLREIHHRVKNNFQIINSLFDLQLLGARNPEVAEALREPRSRIHSMALIHERLYMSQDFASVDFTEYVSELASELFLSYNADPSRIALSVEAEKIALDMDRALPCGLVLNELMTNALKYAFPGPRSGGAIGVRLAREAGSIVLTVWDDGVGVDFDAARESGKSLGLTLSLMLAQQLGGSLELDGSGGVRAVLRFPERPRARRD